MSISSCNFNDLDRGIYLNGIPAAYDVTIEQNSFQFIDDASVFADNTSPFYKLTVSLNDFNDNVAFPDDPGVSIPRPAIRIFSFTPGQQTAWILSNTFVNSSKTGPHFLPYRGIWIQNLNGSLIERNNFTDNFGNTTQPYEGIDVFNASTRFWGNTFAGAGNFNTHPSTGIQVDESPACWLNCNTLDQTKAGVGFKGMNSDGALFERTNFNTHQTGLQLGMDAIIGDQTNRHNAWFGATSNVEALFEGRDPTILDDLLFIQMSNFFIRHSDPSDYWPNPRLIGTTNDQGQWFLPQSGTIGIIWCVLTGESNGGQAAELTVADSRVIAGTFPAVKGYPAGVWEAELRLHRKLSENPELMPAGSPAESWYNGKQGTTLDSLGNIYEGIYQLSAYSHQEQDDLDDADSVKAVLMDEIAAIDEAIGNAAGNPPLIAQLLSDRAVKEAELATAIQTYVAIMTTIRNSRMADAQNLLALVNAVTTTGQYKTDFKTVLRIVLENYLSDGGLNATDRQTLEGIARQCRYSGGMAVLQARASLSDEQDYSAYDNCPEYAGGGNAAMALKPPIVTGLYPNPASQSATLYLGNPDSEGRVILRDMNGRQMDEWTFDGTSKVQLSWGDKIPAGLYLLEIISGTQPPQTLKLLIQQP